MAVVHIVHTHGDAKIHAVVDIATEVEVILADISFMSPVENIILCRIEVGVSVTGSKEQVSYINIIQLVATRGRMVNAEFTICSPEIIEQIVVQLHVSEFVLRCITESVAGREDEVEVAALMVVEREVEERRIAFSRCPDETHLVETEVGGIALAIVGSVLLTHHSRRDIDLAVSEESDTSRVGADGGDVGTERVASASHSHVACRTVEVFGCNFSILICFLCCQGHERSHGGSRQEESCFHHHMDLVVMIK